MSTPAAIYVRISKDSEKSGLGVERQRKDCRALAKRLGWTVAEVYEDNDVSASDGKPRPSFERMRTAVEVGQVKAIAVWDVDRLTRTPRELEDVIEWADRHGLALASVGGEIDLATPQGRLTARIKGSVARHEVEQASRRIRAKHAELAMDGRHNGPRPYGWDIVGRQAEARLVINAGEAAVLRECVQRVLAGDAIWKIVKDLNSRDIRTSTGKPWVTQVLRRVLLRWRNCGVRTHLGKEVGLGQWQPIIDRETHERVVALLTNPARKTNNRGTAPKYLLTSVAYCGECGGYVVGTAEFNYRLKNGRMRHYPHSYKCAAAGCMKVQRRMADVDDHVTRVVLGILERDGVRLLGGDPATADAARTRIDAIEAKLALLADQFVADTITGDQLTRATAPLREQLDAERVRLSAAQPDAGLADYVGPTAAAAWAKADVETRKHIIRAIGMRITINRVGAGNGREYDPESVTIAAA